MEDLTMLAPAIPVPTAARSDRSDRTLAVAVGVILAAWFGLAALVSARGLLVTELGQPPLPLLASVLLPVGVSVAVYASSARVRRFVRSGDPGLLTAIQSWRVLGLVFLVLMGFGLMPSAFALPAGIGDVAIGVTAPFVAWALAAWGPRRAGGLFVTWHWLGMLDLALAVGTGASIRASGADPTGGEQMVMMSQLPLSLIPAFAVPLFVILHLASLAQCRARTRAEDDR
jgi:hypothetical protein